MDYTSKTVRSRPGLSQEQALASLQESPLFAVGTRIASIKPRGDRWIAKLEIPKTAGPFPPSDGGEEESAPPKSEGEESEGGEESSDSPSDDGADSGPPGEGGDKPKGDKPGSDAQVVQILTQILHALQGGAPMGGMGGPDDLGPGAGGPPAPPPHGGPAGGPGGAPKPPMGAGRPIKPGEVPNKPGVTPIGSPAFSSNNFTAGNQQVTATMGGPLSPGPNPTVPGAAAPVPGPTSQGGTGSCAQCGGPVGPDGACPTCGGSYVAALKERISKVAGKTGHMTVTAPNPQLSVTDTVRLVRAVAEPYGYKVKQAKRVNGRAAVLLSVR